MPSDRLADSFAAVERFAPTGPPDTELEWFFTMSEGDMGATSNFTQSLTYVLPHERAGDSAESRAEASHAHRVILGRLRQLDTPHAGILQAAYEARPWPLPLREALGRSTGVVVRLASAEVGIPEDRHQRDALDVETAGLLTDGLKRRGRSALESFELRARVLLRGAFLAYEHARGGHRKPLLPGVS